MKTKVIVVLVYFMTTIQNAYGRFMMHNTPALHGHSRHTKVDMDTTYAIIIMFLTFVSACMLLSIYYAYSELKHQKNKKVEEEKKKRYEAIYRGSYRIQHFYRFVDDAAIPPTYKLTKFPFLNEYSDYTKQITILNYNFLKVDFSALIQIYAALNKQFIFDIDTKCGGQYDYVPSFLWIGATHINSYTCEWNKEKFIFIPKEDKYYLKTIGKIESISNEKDYVCRSRLEKWYENTKQFLNIQSTYYIEK